MAKRAFDPDKEFSLREVAGFLNNAVVATRRMQNSSIPDDRTRKLHAYTKELVAPIVDHIDAQYLRHAEAVYILAAAALYMHLKYHMADEKVPYKPSNVVVIDMDHESLKHLIEEAQND